MNVPYVRSPTSSSRLPLNSSVHFNNFCSLLHVCVCAHVSHCGFIFCAIFVCTIDVFSHFILVERRLNLVGKSYYTKWCGT